MATQKIDVLIDDLTGAEGAETFEFAGPVDGKPYTLDLVADSQASVEADLAAITEAKAEYDAIVASAAADLANTITEKSGWFMEAARPKRAARKSTPNDGKGAVIRAWASENGYEVPARGRLSKEVHEAFAAAHPA